MNILLYILCALILGISNLSFADSVLKSDLGDQKSVEVTVYNSNIGLVKDTRTIVLPQGKGELHFMDVAASVMPETVHIKPLDPLNSVSILEQNYEYDLINETKLLDKYIGKKIKLLKENPYNNQKETVEAILLSNNSGQVYQVGNEIYLGFDGQKILPQMPENLVAQPTLTWLYNSPTAGKKPVEVSYLTNGLNWKAAYVLVVDESDTKGGLSGWVSLSNNSGATYNNAKLKLVAGQVNRAQDLMAVGRVYAAKAIKMEQDSGSAFTEKSFFEYHIYDLARLTTIKDNENKQVSLLEANDLKVQKEFIVGNSPLSYFFQIYRTNDYKVPVNVFINFKNSKENNLGMPLPAGTIRLYKSDSDKSLQFIGEDNISHTPKDENVRLKIGEAFDVVAERKQTDYKLIANNLHQSSWEVTLRNHKKEDIIVSVLENMESYGQWDIVTSSHGYQKQDVSSVKFNVPVPKDGEVKLTYTVQIRTAY
ncbi:MAG: DUF4139 domain-containing protein [Candidatus Omnitrophica bacterium]|nr:DUF4139 domain-containing protein [Candidatus Omnitrophota bacterium]